MLYYTRRKYNSSDQFLYQFNVANFVIEKRREIVS
jgi:hypothetical protein